MADYRDRDYRHSYLDSRSKSDDPPNSRLFVVCSKSHDEEDMKAAFEKFGKIEDIWVVKNRVTGENKGVAYIKFSKTTEAAYALEEMNGKILGSSNRPIKVMIASNRDQGNQNDPNEVERWVRLFCILPKSMTEEELEREFCKYGPIEYVTVVKDRSTHESKGFGYVKFSKVSSAARAFEECDRKYKAVFADPKKSKFDSHNDAKINSFASFDALSMLANKSLIHKNVIQDMNNEIHNPEGSRKLLVSCRSDVNPEQLQKLFDIIPGMESFDTRSEYQNIEERRRMPMSQITVVYNSPQQASYAFQKLNDFEYPNGHRLKISLDRPLTGSLLRKPSSVLQDLSKMEGDGRVDIYNMTNDDLKCFAISFARIAAMVERAGVKIPNIDANEYTDLPNIQPMASVDAPVAKRCFIVCSLPIPPHNAIKDMFARFGNLIDIYMLPGKNVGYAKYATEESANRAIEVMHGREICGSRVKVMEAEERNNDHGHHSGNDRKRMKFDNEQN